MTDWIEIPGHREWVHAVSGMRIAPLEKGGFRLSRHDGTRTDGWLSTVPLYRDIPVAVCSYVPAPHPARVAIVWFSALRRMEDVIVEVHPVRGWWRTPDGALVPDVAANVDGNADAFLERSDGRWETQIGDVFETLAEAVDVCVAFARRDAARAIAEAAE